MTQATAARLQISLSDVARLARVQRPVVSMWRTRSARTEHPFPRPIRVGVSPETFDAAEISAWLSATGRGNNPDAGEDIAAFAALGDASPRGDRAVFDAVTALLCLAVITGRRLGGLDCADLLDLADEVDPDDELLYGELHAVGDRLEALARHAQRLADASVSPPAAFEKLMADRFRSALPEHSSVALSATARSLVAKIAVTLAGQGDATSVYVDPTPGSSDLLLAVVGEHGDRGPSEVRTAASSVPAARLARRRLRVHDVYRTDLDVDGSGALTVSGPATHVAQFPGPGDPVMTDVQILTAIENVVVQMDEVQTGVVIAPASALCDGFTDRDGVGIRADLLRAGHVRAIVRLPKGLATARSRQALALWILGPSHHEDEAAERRTMVADLADIALTGEVIDSLVTDVTAATGRRDLVRAHAFAFLDPVPTRVLLTATRSLVEARPPNRSAGAADAATLLLRIEQVRGLLDEPLPPPDLAGVAVGPEPGQTPPGPAPAATIATMLGARRLRTLAGNRLATADLRSGASVGVAAVRIIGVPELLGTLASGTRSIDWLLLAERYDSARLSEPGDVVFCTSPRPAALVDRVGGSVVAFPARVLRVDSADPGGLVPDLVAADICAAPAGARQWRRWPLRTVSDTQRAGLTDALTELREAKEQAQLRLAQLSELEELLTRAAIDGSLTLQPPTRPTHNPTRGT